MARRPSSAASTIHQSTSGIRLNRYIPSSELDMDRRRPRLMVVFLTEVILLLSQEMAPMPGEVVVKSTEEGTAHTGHSAKCGAAPAAIISAGCITERGHRDQLLILVGVLDTVLLSEDVVPGALQITSFKDTWRTNHLSMKWLTRLCTMEPSRLRLISDQPILQLFVRSTRLCQRVIEADGASIETDTCSGPIYRRH